MWLVPLHRRVSRHKRRRQPKGTVGSSAQRGAEARELGVLSQDAQVRVGGRESGAREESVDARVWDRVEIGAGSDGSGVPGGEGVGGGERERGREGGMGL